MPLPILNTSCPGDDSLLDRLGRILTLPPTPEGFHNFSPGSRSAPRVKGPPQDPPTPEGLNMRNPPAKWLSCFLTCPPLGIGSVARSMPILRRCKVSRL